MDTAASARVAEFEELRPLLFSIAYRLLGSVAEAEDAVQESWLRYASSPTVRCPRAAKCMDSAASPQPASSTSPVISP